MDNSKLKVPVYHQLKYQPGHYAKVYWPTHKGKNVCICNSSVYARPNGSTIQVISIFEGKMFPIVNYQINDNDQVVSAPLHWFANNIANS